MRTILAPAVAASIVFAATAAFSQDCHDQVAATAARLGLDASPPQAMVVDPKPGGGATIVVPESDGEQRALAHSGVIIAPPAGDEQAAVIEAPEGVDPNMPTVPAIEPEPGTPAIQAEATRNLQVESLLVAANQAARAGDNEQCLQRLQQAAALAEDDFVG